MKLIHKWNEWNKIKLYDKKKKTELKWGLPGQRINIRLPVEMKQNKKKWEIFEKFFQIINGHLSVTKGKESSFV